MSLLLLALAGTGIGLLVAAVAASSKIANAMSMVLFFPLMFLAGLWVPRAVMPRGLRTASDLSPWERACERSRTVSPGSGRRSPARW